GVVGALRGKSLGDMQPVHAVDPVEILRDQSGLVGLYPADEMPRRRQATLAQGGDFPQCFLEIPLAEMLDARPGRHLEGACRLAYADGHWCDRVGTPAGLRRRGGDAIAHTLNVRQRNLRIP